MPNKEIKKIGLTLAASIGTGGMVGGGIFAAVYLVAIKKAIEISGNKIISSIVLLMT